MLVRLDLVLWPTFGYQTARKKVMLLVIEKARVAPLKQVTMPHLELAPAVSAVSLDKMLSAQLQLNLHESVFWSDSMTAKVYCKHNHKV